MAKVMDYFQPQSFDLITAFVSFMYLRDVGEMSSLMRNVSELLSSKGYFFISEPTKGMTRTGCIRASRGANCRKRLRARALRFWESGGVQAFLRLTASEQLLRRAVLEYADTGICRLCRSWNG
jgi:hypothetical protein